MKLIWSKYNELVNADDEDDISVYASKNNTGEITLHANQSNQPSNTVKNLIELLDAETPPEVHQVALEEFKLVQSLVNQYTLCSS